VEGEGRRQHHRHHQVDDATPRFNNGGGEKLTELKRWDELRPHFGAKLLHAKSLHTLGKQEQTRWHLRGGDSGEINRIWIESRPD